MALEDVAQRLRRICKAFETAGVPFALVGGQAVALWVATRDPAAVRTTKDIDLLLCREDLPRARAAADAAGMDYFEVMGVGMFLTAAPNPRTPSIWSGRAAASARNTTSPRRPSTSVKSFRPGCPRRRSPAWFA